MTTVPQVNLCRVADLATQPCMASWAESEEKQDKQAAWLKFFKDLQIPLRGALSPNRGLFDDCPLQIRCEAVRAHCKAKQAVQHCCQLKLHLQLVSSFLESSFAARACFNAALSLD